ncbi:MAG TPA: hemerythrin domain-containing protein [Chitinophagaceae bacterium]
MERLNIFNQIHKGLRAMLYNTALTIQQTDFSIEEEGKATLRKLRIVLDLYSQHGDHEDNKVFPKVLHASAGTVAALEAEHDKDEQLINDLLLDIRRYKNANGKADRVAIGYSIHLSFQEFVAFNLQHMCKEEKLINPLLWQHYTDDEIGQIQHEIVSSISPEDNAQYARWMLLGSNDAEIRSWLEKVRATAPRPVWDGLYQLATDELGAERVSGIMSHEVTRSVIY